MIIEVDSSGGVPSEQRDSIGWPIVDWAGEWKMNSMCECGRVRAELVDWGATVSAADEDWRPNLQ